MIAKVLPNTINLEQSWENLADSQVQKEMMEKRFFIQADNYDDFLIIKIIYLSRRRYTLSWLLIFLYFCPFISVFWGIK